ncbi:LLM class F420-dependent oxidoreductase [Nonomuraea jiangxiensis]|uniref:Probable F420-dependent oxidoreductase, Rv3520c family n=1 Tax=Nonomuraea jiangxiensis TaxID=633440 RepID=A0A1G8EJJ8_9ACTN|nr:LLM class F420-dependent oxidoreductase [Nonomuraea jiangxiensis]SDH70123.1 probable F420-dependent oxidoreductase, Rv3520c family [Nonomuraea jiangxiensis]
MRLGFSIGTLGPVAATHDAQLTLVREAERLGYDSVWASEGYGVDPATTLAWLAAGTERIGLGSGVIQVTGRTAISTAMAATTIDRVSGGRFLLGLGASGPQVAEGWHGQRYERPLAHLRDYVTVVRTALEGRPVEHTGPEIVLPLPDSRGKALSMTVSPVRQPLPIHLAAMGPKAVALAGEVADGWLPIHFPPEHLVETMEHLRAGAARSGRDADRVEVSPMVMAMVDDDADYARDLIRPMLALYLGGMGTRGVNFYNRLAHRLGFGPAAARVQDAYFDGDLGEAMEEVPDDLVDALALCGTPARVRERLEAYRKAGATRLIVGLNAPTVEDRAEQLGWLAELAA